LACDQQSVPLSEEIAFLKAYIEIHQLLVRDRVQFELQVQPNVWAARIPPMLLQPLVENAVIHGAHSAGHRANTVRLLAERSDSKLRITIENDLGPEIDKPLTNGHRLTRGIGLRNTRERLQVLYGEAQNFSFTREAGLRAIVTLEIPFSETAGERHE
jgi:LytS/YehU family sensor histidine kinase